MIDEDRTMQLFDYTSNQLSPKSHKKIVVVCEECGKYRVVREADYRELCNLCSAPKGENNSSWKGGQAAKVCEVCGTGFTVKVSAAKNGRGRFCSRECMGKWVSENLRGENCPSWDGGKVTKACGVCGKAFSVFPSQSHHKFCSRECQGKYQSEARRGIPHPRGENSPLFNKPRSLEARKRISATKQSIPYDEWEEFAKESPYCPRFNEACRESNREKYDRRCFLSDMTEDDNGQKLSVHHYDMNKAQGCDGHAWKLVPLCRKLHNTSHSSTWAARIIYLLEHVWNPRRDDVVS